MASLCDSKNLNTGLGTCDKGIGRIDYMIFAPDGAPIPISTTLDLFAFLKSKVEAVNPYDRWFIVPRKVNQSTLQSTDPVMSTLADGSSVQQVPGNAIFLLEWWATMCHDKVINKFNQYDGPAYAITSNRWVIGSDGETNALYPMPNGAKVSVSGGGLQTTDPTPNTKKMMVNLGDELEYQNLLRYLPLADNARVTLLKGYRDLKIRVLNTDGGVATVQLVTDCEDVNVYDQYSTEFTATSMWRADGSQTVISLVTLDVANKAFKLTMPAGSHVIDLAPVDKLKENNVTGYEGLPASVTVTA